MPSSYGAKSTKTPAESLAELERAIARYGGANLELNEGARRVFVEFDYCERRRRFELPLPAQLSQPARAVETRRRWRSLVLVVKALLEGVDAGILDPDLAFMAETVMPESGATVWEVYGGAIREAYQRQPLALPAGTERSG